MTDKEFQIKKRLLNRKLKERQMKAELRKLKWSWLPKIKKPNTSKLIVLVTFLICLQILWFAEKMVYSYADTSYMYVLLGVPVSLIPVTLGYLSKSGKENRKDGITYDIAMEELKHKFEMENMNSSSAHNYDENMFDNETVDNDSDEESVG